MIALISPKTGADYVKYLEERSYDHLVTGTEHIDLPGALSSLGTKYGIETILVDSGPTLNGVLLGMGLIDEISLLVVPVLVGRRSSDLLSCLNTRNQNVNLGLLSREYLDEGLVLLRYRVLRRNS